MIDDYFKLQEKIYKYFGYQEDWVVIPIDDRREYYWYLPEGGSEVSYWKSKELAKNKDFTDKDGYIDEIYTQRFLPKWVYKAKEMTMIVVDTHTDGNKFLAIYDNSKQL